MNHIKSYGICTRNEQGMFEVHWEVESTWYKKLFKVRTEFKYMCVNRHLGVNGEFYSYYNVDWYDRTGTKLIDDKTLHTIKYILQLNRYKHYPVLEIKEEY